MADADGRSSVPPLPPLPPLDENESQQPAQHFPTVGFSIAPGVSERASSIDRASNTPPQRILRNPSSANGDSLSSVTYNTTSPAVVPATAPRTNNAASFMSPTTPDFSKAHSDINGYLSGDDEDAWENEADMVMEAAAEQQAGEEEDVSDDGDEILKEVSEFEQLVEEALEEEQAAEDADVYETVVVTKSFTIPQLKEIAKAIKVSMTGTKPVLFARIRDSGSDLIVKGDDESFQFKKKVSETGASAARAENDPYWFIPSPEIPPSIPGVDMATGAEIGFFGPTNTNNIAGAQRHNFLTNEVIARPVFMSIDPMTPVSDEGHPSQVAFDSISDIQCARPIEFFNLLITPRFIEKTMLACTNQKAAGEGAGTGGTVYTDYVQFDVDEMYRFIGVLFANGLSPKPDFLKWFDSTGSDPLLGNNFIAPLMNKKMQGGGMVPGVRRWKHFRRFLCLYDSRSVNKRQVDSDPLWKVRLFLRHLNNNSKSMWVTGKNLSVDEQTIAFKGRSSMKLRISYKKEGDGFQCDAICDRGYTFAFWFRHGDPPVLPSFLNDLKLPPTSRRVVWLAQQLPNYWTRIYMDNLFNSTKLFSALYRVKALAHGVVRTSGRGFPPSIKQDEEKNAAKAEQLKGTTKAAVLKNSTDTPNMIAASVYDNKPVHLMSTASGKVEWVEKKRRVWSSAAGCNRMMSHMRLNLIDEYNQHMNSTDIADQLRNAYRPDHWTRNKKWWWAIFVWGIGVAQVNAFLIYCAMHDDAKKKKKPGLPKKWSHREFIHELILDLMSHSSTRKRSRSSSNFNNNDEQSQTSSSRVSHTRNCSSGDDNDEDVDLTCESGIAEALKKYKPFTVTPQRIQNPGFFSRRFDGRQHPTLPTESYCQYCRYQFQHVLTPAQQQASKLMGQNRKLVRRCLVCNVNLCSSCEHEFHGITAQDLGIYFRNKK